MALLLGTVHVDSRKGVSAQRYAYTEVRDPLLLGCWQSSRMRRRSAYRCRLCRDHVPYWDAMIAMARPALITPKPCSRFDPGTTPGLGCTHAHSAVHGHLIKWAGPLA